MLWEDELKRQRDDVRARRGRLLSAPSDAERDTQGASLASGPAFSTALAAAFAIVSIVGPARAVRLGMQAIALVALAKRVHGAVDLAAQRGVAPGPIVKADSRIH